VDADLYAGGRGHEGGKGGGLNRERLCVETGGEGSAGQGQDEGSGLRSHGLCAYALEQLSTGTHVCM